MHIHTYTLVYTGEDGCTDRTVVTDTTEICMYLSHDRDVTPRKVHPVMNIHEKKL